MGEDEKEKIDGVVRRLARDSFRFVRSKWVPYAIPPAIVGAYLAYVKLSGEGEVGEELKEIYLPKGLSSLALYFLFAAGCSLGGLFGVLSLANHFRRKKGMSPVKISKYLKQAFFLSPVGKGEEGFMEACDAFPDSSRLHSGLGDLYFRQGNVIEAMEAYYKAINLRDAEIFPKVPFLGPNLYMTDSADKIDLLKRKLADEPKNSRVLLELAMRYFLITDFENSIKHFEMVNKEEDPIAFHILASRLYLAVSERRDRPKLGRLSFGDSRAGRFLDRSFFFWRRQKIDSKETRRKAKAEARAAIEEVLSLGNLDDYLEVIGDYKVYRIGLNSFVRGFVVLKQGNYENLKREMMNELVFGSNVAGGKFRAAHPSGIVNYKGRAYLILLYEEGIPLSASTNPDHFRDAISFAARSDALMPLEHICDREYRPERRFERRVFASDIPEKAKLRISENSAFLFNYSGAFPVVFDGDWHPANCLVDSGGNIIALDKEDKGVTIGPVTAARILNQGAIFGEKDESEDDDLKDDMIEKNYIRVYQKLADRSRRIDEPQLFLPMTLASTINKAIAAYCFTLQFPERQESARIFLHKALHAGKRIRGMDGDGKLKRFYSDDDRKHCLALESVIYDELLAVRVP